MHAWTPTPKYTSSYICTLLIRTSHHTHKHLSFPVLSCKDALQYNSHAILAWGSQEYMTILMGPHSVFLLQDIFGLLPLLGSETIVHSVCIGLIHVVALRHLQISYQSPSSCWWAFWRSNLYNRRVPTPFKSATWDDHRSSIKQACRLNNTGAIVYLCLKPFSTLMSFASSSLFIQAIHPLEYLLERVTAILFGLVGWM